MAETLLDKLKATITAECELDYDRYADIVKDVDRDKAFIGNLVLIITHHEGLPSRTRAVICDEWVTALRRDGSYFELSFTKVDVARIGAACNIVRRDEFERIRHHGRVAVLWDAVMDAQQSLSQLASTAR